MEIKGQAVLLRIFVGESDKIGHLPLHEAIVRNARDAGLAGATVLKGVLGYGATHHIRTTKILDLSADLPMVIEIVDEQSKVEWTSESRRGHRYLTSFTVLGWALVLLLILLMVIQHFMLR